MVKGGSSLLPLAGEMNTLNVVPAQAGTHNHRIPSQTRNAIPAN